MPSHLHANSRRVLPLHGRQRLTHMMHTPADATRLALSSSLQDLGLVVSLGGAILGSALVYIFPALMAVYEKKGATGKVGKLPV